MQRADSSLTNAARIPREAPTVRNSHQERDNDRLRDAETTESSTVFILEHSIPNLPPKLSRNITTHSNTSNRQHSGGTTHPHRNTIPTQRSSLRVTSQRDEDVSDAYDSSDCEDTSIQKGTPTGNITPKRCLWGLVDVATCPRFTDGSYCTTTKTILQYMFPETRALLRHLYH